MNAAARALKETVLRLYSHVAVEGAEPTGIEEFLANLGTGPAYPYAVASAERNMFLCSWAARAVRAGLFDEHWEETIQPAVAARIAKTPYTNYAGD